MTLPATTSIDGWTHPDFHPVVNMLRAIVGDYGGGAAVCVYHRGVPVVDVWGGRRNHAGEPWSADTMAPSFSTTKGVASTLLHIMVDRGLLDYDDRVSRYWPEFAQAGKERITVRHILTHQSGLYHIRQMIDHADRMRDWSHMIEAIERASPMHEPGARTGYHGLTYGFLVGEILQRVTHRRFSQLVRDELARPLHLDGMYVGAPSEGVGRAAQLMWPRRMLFGPHLFALEGTTRGRCLLQASKVVERIFCGLGFQVDVESILDALAPRGIAAFDFGSPETLRTAIPAANGLFTARSLAKMYAALAGGGEIESVRLLSRRTLARATRVQGSSGHRLVIPWDMRWRLGYHSIFTTAGSPRRAFGHFGFGGSGAFADPERNLAVALIVNSGFGTPFGDLRIMRIGGAALSCATQRPLRHGVLAMHAHPTPGRLEGGPLVRPTRARANAMRARRPKTIGAGDRRGDTHGGDHRRRDSRAHAGARRRRKDLWHRRRHIHSAIRPVR